jgi:DNA-binding transcriptional LysR family regulator
MADRRLQVVHAVAKQLSFSKEAEVLLMTQPAVTFQIKQLEEHFNTRLFDHGHGRMALTPRLIRTLSMVYPKEKFRSRLAATFVEFALLLLRALISKKQA